MRKPSPARLLVIVLLLFCSLPQTFARASGTPYGSVTIVNRNDTDTALSCDVRLSGNRIEGSVFAVLFSESRQVKSVAEYPAEKNMRVSLEGVSQKDYIRILWTDENHMPLGNPVDLRRRETDTAAYESFTKKMAASLQQYGGMSGASDIENPYALARLLVSCETLPDLGNYADKVETISGPDNLYVLQFYDPAEAIKCKTYLESTNSVRYVEADAITQVVTGEKSGPDSPPHSWGVEKTGIGEYAEYLRQKGNARSVTVAVVDSGVEMNHPFLKNRLIEGYDFVRYNKTPQDEHGHGTHVAGTIVDCTSGVDVKIMPVRVLNAFASGSYLSIASGIRHAADHGADIINLSLGSANHSHTIDEAIDYALSKNITVVAAAGNRNGNVEHFCPAHIEGCITVAAVDRALERYELSNYGDSVDIAAPGVGIESSILKGKYGEMNGTSMATPHVSAAAALLMSERGTGQTPYQISGLLRGAATDLGVSGHDVYFGAGFLNMRPFIVQSAYAMLYADGELVFQKSSTPDPDRELVQSYPVAASGESGGQYTAWHARHSDIRKVTFAEPIKPTATALWFYGCENLSEVRGLENLDASGLTDMSQMFARCGSLKTLDLSALGTGSVKKMSSMFFHCEALTELDLTGWDTKNVTDTRDMFIGCAKLKTVYVSNSFSTEKLTDSEGMFQSCSALVGGQDTPFDGAHTDKAYARIDGGPSAPGYFTDKNAPKPEPEPSGDVYAILYSDGALTFQRGDTPESGRTVKKTYKVDLNAIYGGDDYEPWYNERKSILAVNFADKISPGATAFWFYECENLERVNNIRNLDTSGVTTMSHMFTDCAGLPTLDLSSFNTANVTDMNWMFGNCSVLTDLNVSGFNTANVTAMASMFSGCSGLTALDVSSFDTANVENMFCMFNGCSGLTALDVSCLDTANVTVMSWMFSGCSNLQTIYASDKFTTASETFSPTMFDGCTSLVGGAGTKYDDGHTDISYARIDGGPSAPGYFTDKSSQGETPIQILVGDINGDGIIDASDLIMLREVLEENRTLTEREFTAADMNKDDSVDMKDYVLLTRYLDPIPGVPTVTLDSVTVAFPTDSGGAVSNLRTQDGAEAEVLTSDTGAPMFHITWGKAEDGGFYTVLILPEDELPTEENVVYMNILEAKDGVLDFTAYPSAMTAGAYCVLISGQDGGITQAATFDIGGAASVGIPVSVENLTNVTALVIEVTYPEDALAVRGVADNGIFQDETDNSRDKKSPLTIVWGSDLEPNGVTYSGELCTIQFDVLGGAKDGTYEIGLAVTDAINSDLEDIYCTAVNGVLTIAR